MDALRQDLRYAVRNLLRSRGFALVAISTLALGIGANTAIFSVIDGILLRPLPFAQPERLVAVWPGLGFQPAEYAAVREQSRSFQELALYRPGVELSLTAGEPERLRGALASANLFSTLGVSAHLGRTLAPGEDAPGSDDVVVLSYGLWRRRFGADPGVVGRQLEVDGSPRTVVGVMPAGFHFPTAGTQLWVPLTVDPANVGSYWGAWGGEGVGRLRPGVEPAQAEAELSGFPPRLRLDNPLWTPDADYKADARVVSLDEEMVGEVRPMLLVLLGAVGLVLLVACANLGNLLLARSLARRHEIAVRSALGASRGRLVRQLVTESLVLALAGGVAGIAVGFAGLRALLAALPPETPRLAEVAMDGRVLAFALLATALTALLFGLLPALRAAADVQPALRQTRGAGERSRLAAGLVSAEIALAVVLMAGAGLLIKSLWNLLEVDLGFRTERVVSARVSPPELRYDGAAARLTFHQSVLDRVEAVPGIESAAVTSQLPFDQAEAGWATFVEGVHTDPRATLPMFDRRSVSPGYFQVLGVPLLRGRAFSGADREGSPLVALIDEAAAEQFWPGEDPLGKRLGWPWANEWRTVVGVVGAVRNNELAGEARPAVYLPLAQSPGLEMTLVARTALEPASIARDLRAAVAGVDPGVPVGDVRPMARLVDESIAGPRLAAFLLGGFAAVALLLGAVGIYGAMAYSVARRTREIGVRLALGAGRADVVGMVVAQGARLTVAGLIAGVLGAFVAVRALRGLLYQVSPLDPATFALVALLLAGTALLAAYVPARRASRVDPTEALRAD